MKISQSLLDRLAARLADNHSNFQLQAMFARQGYSHWESRGSSKFNRTLSVLADIAATEPAEHIMGGIFEHVGERLNWKMLQGQANKFDRQLVAALRADGYEIFNGKVMLAPPLGSLSDTAGPLVAALESLGWDTAKGHLMQALDNFQRGNWASCNSQLRATLEEVFNSIAKLTPRSANAPVGGNARKHLQATGALSHVEAEFIQAWFNVLHTSGAHPGLSSREDTRWRLFVTAATVFWAPSALASPVTGLNAPGRSGTRQ
ncbi:MAG: hypothetical protein HYY46_07955 [Deltaproteobacteria bacterium]|nr:hypothetical protein [Deltaproteobacteria bacterium]